MFLGIDIGTSSVKAVLIAEDQVVAEASRPLSTLKRHPGWSEQMPDAWWQAAVAAVNALEGRGAVQAIGLSGQMHAAVLLDRADAVIRPAILWNDARAAAEAAQLAAVPGLAEQAGVVPMAGLTAPKLMWLKAHEPDAWSKIACLLSVKDWIGWKLHGQRATDVSDAAGTLWLDEAQRNWSGDLASASGVEPAWLPPVLEGPDEAGRLRPEPAEALGLPAGIPVVAGAGDTVAGAVGIGAVRPGRSFLGLGTSGQIVTLDDAYSPVVAGMIHAFAFCLPGIWYRMAAMLNGARPMAWFAGVAGRPVGELLAAAAASPPENAPIFLPYLTGERTPHGDAAIRAAFLGLGDGTDAGAMMRGVVEAIAYSFADAAKALGNVGSEPPLAVGGGAASDLLLQTISDVLSIPVLRPAEASHGAAYGAARLAAYHRGALSDGDLARQPAIARRFEPVAAAAERHAGRLARYRAIYQAIRGI